MSKKLLFNFNREVIQNYTYVKYVGTIITATNTLEKPIKSAILKGSTKYRDIDTGEVLDAFEDGRNLELVSVRMPVLTTSDTAFIDNKVALKIDAISNPPGQIAFNTVNGDGIQLNNPSSVAGVGFNGDCLISGENVYFSYDYNDKLYACEVIYEQHEQTSGSVWGFFVEGSFQVHQRVRSIVSKKAGWFETKSPVFEYNQKIHILFVNDFEKKTKSIFLNGDRIAYAEGVSFANTDFNAETITFLQNITGKIYKLTLYNQPLTDEEIIAIFKRKDKTDKTNILSCNEDVTLHGMGNVKDELDLLTGELTERIREIVLNGSEDWSIQVDSNWHNDTHISFRFAIDDMKGNNWNSGKTNCISDKFKTKVLNDSSYIMAEEFIGSDGARLGLMFFNIKLLRSRLNGNETVDGFKQWLSQNPLTIQYELGIESIKTVDLSILDQNENKVSSISSFNDTTHITASSETIPPIFEGYLATKEVE